MSLNWRKVIGREGNIGVRRVAKKIPVHLPYLKGRSRIVVDHGTTNTKITINDSDVFTLPTALLIETATNRIVDHGLGAYQSLGRTPAGMEVVFPIQKARTAEPWLIKEFMRRAIKDAQRELGERKIDKSAQVLLTAHTNADGTTVGTMYRCGQSVMKEICDADQVFMSDQSFLGAIGCGLDIMTVEGCLMGEIGGGSFDISAIVRGKRAENGTGYCLHAGQSINELIAKYIKTEHNMIAGEMDIEAVKLALDTAIGYGEYLELLDKDYPEDPKAPAKTDDPSAAGVILINLTDSDLPRLDTTSGNQKNPGKDKVDALRKKAEVLYRDYPVLKELKGKPSRMVIRGKRNDPNNPLPMDVELTRREISKATFSAHHARALFVRDMVGKAPAGLSGSMQKAGIVLGGRAALTPGITRCIYDHVNRLPADVHEHAPICVALGGQIAMRDKDMFNLVAWVPQEG